MATDFRVPMGQSGARMPEYQRRNFTTPGADVSARLSDAAAGIYERGADQTGKQLMALGGAVQEAAKVGNELYMDYQTSKAKEAWLAYKQEAAKKQAELATLQGKNALGDSGVEAQLRQWQQATRQNLSKNLGGMATKLFDNAAAQTDAGLDSWAVGKVHTEALRFENKTSEAHISLLQDEALANANDPAELAKRMSGIKGELKAIAGRSGLDETWINAEFKSDQQKILTKAIADRIEGEQMGEAASLIRTYGSELGGAAETLKARFRAKGRELESRARAARVEARIGITQRSQDAVASWMSGVPFNNAPSREEFIAAYGKEQGERLFQGQQETRQLGEDLTALRAKTPAEQEALLKEREPSQGEGYAQRFEHFNKLKMALATDAKQRKDDPAGYVAMHSPDVKEARQAMWASFSPETARVYAIKTQSALEARGISFPADTPVPILADSDAQALASRIAAAPDKLKVLNELSNSFGSYWPNVERQLTLGEKLPPAVSIVASGMKGRAANLLLTAAGTKDFTAGAKQGLGQNYKVMQEEVGSALAEFLTTVRASGDMQTELKLTDSTEKLAAQYMLTDSSNARDAARKAAEEVVTARYTLKGSYRVPKNVNADLVDRGAQKEQARIAAAALSLQLPQEPGLTREQNAARYGGQIVRNGEWVNAPGEKSLILFTGGIPVRNADGSLVRRTWEELQQASSDTYKIGMSAEDIKKLEEMAL